MDLSPLEVEVRPLQGDDLAPAKPGVTGQEHHSLDTGIEGMGSSDEPGVVREEPHNRYLTAFDTTPQRLLRDRRRVRFSCIFGWMRNESRPALREGIYRVYDVRSDGERLHYDLGSRFEIMGRPVNVMEDRTGLLTLHVVSGLLTVEKHRFLLSLVRGSYSHVVVEQPGVAYI